MTINTLYRLDKVIYPSIELRRVKSVDHSAGIDQMIERSAGEVQPDFLATSSQKPMIRFGTQQLATLLGGVPLGGLALSSVINTYFKKVSEIGNLARATTQHKRIAINKSVSYITQIRLPHNGPAEADVTICAVFDGTNAPFVYTGSLALSGTMTATDEVFGAGPLSINGVSIPGIQEITIETGIQLVHESDASEVYPSFCGIQQNEPVVTVKTREEVNWSTFGLAGSALDGSAGVRFFARRLKQDQARYLDSDAVHIKFQGLLGRVLPENSQGRGSDYYSHEFRCSLRQSAESSTLLAVTIDSQIT